MSKVEDRLWAELVQEHSEELTRLSSMAAAAHRRAPRVRRGPLAATGVALAAGTTAAALALGAGSSTPAFAVSENADGSVTLTINEIVGVSAANEELARLGVRAVVEKPEAGCTASGDLIPVAPGTPYPAQQRQIVQPLPGDGPMRWIIHPDAIPQGDTLALSASLQAVDHGRLRAESFGAALYRGAAPACRPAGTGPPAGQEPPAPEAPAHY